MDKVTRALNLYGSDRCVAMALRNRQGDGARNLGYEFGLGTRQADAAIAAGLALLEQREKAERASSTPAQME